MKKLIFLLLMAVVLVGFVSALDTAHPPGVLTLEALSGDGVEDCAVIPDTVLVSAVFSVNEPSSFQVVMALHNESAIRPQSGIMDLSMSTIFGQACAADYYLRC